MSGTTHKIQTLLLCLSVCSILATPGGPAYSNDEPNTAYRAGTISLPSVDEAASGDPSTVSVNQGRIAFRVPIVTPPGKAGVEPDLALTFTGGRTERALGAGWTLGLPVLRVKTSGRGGQPDYGTRAAFLGLSGEELIEVGSLSDVDGDGSDEVVLREERDLSYQRYVQLSAGGWRVDFPDGRKLTLGTSSDAQIVRTGGTDASYAAWIAAWLPEKLEDPSGNQMLYTWSSADEADDGVANGSAISDVARYLTETRWGCQSCAGALAYQRVALSYEIRSTAGFANVLDFSPGFLVEWELHLSQVETFTMGSGTSQSVRTTTLTYGDTDTRRMLLAEVAVSGADGTSLPATRFTYTDGDEPADVVSTLDPSSVPGTRFASGVIAMDFDKDGRVDIVDLSASTGGWYSHASASGAAFSTSSEPITDMPALGGLPRSANVSVVDANRDLGLDTQDLINHTTEIGDADGDGESGERLYPFYAHEGETGWAATTTTFGGSFNSNLVHTDIDRDGYVDIVSTSTGGWDVSLDDSTHDYDDASLQIACASDASPTKAASQSGLLLGDVNGDDLVDAVYLIAGVGARVWFGRGRYCWGLADDDGHGSSAYVEYDITSASSTQRPQGSDTRLLDVNGDGFDDLVMISRTRVGVWTFHPVDGFVNVGFWSQRSYSSRDCRTADFDADGVTEVLCSYNWSLYDLADGSTHRLESVDNGLGVVTRINYTTSGRVAALHEEAGDPWTTNVAAPIRVVSRVEVDDSRGHVLVKSYDYRDAYYMTDAINDRYEFVGFGFVEAQHIPFIESPSRSVDPMDPGVLKRAFFDVGESDWNLRGQLTCQELWSGDAAPTSFACGGSTGALERTELDLASTTNADGISFVEVQAQTKTILEGESSGESIYTQFRYDDYGNVTLEAAWGLYKPHDQDYGDDEAAVATQWVNDTTRWMLRFPARIRRGGISRFSLYPRVHTKATEYLLYDGNSHWSTSSLTEGNLTERRVWTFDPVTRTSSTDVVEQRNYTLQGLVDEQIRADGSVIDHEYDGLFGLFLTSTTTDPGGAESRNELCRRHRHRRHHRGDRP